jgi:phosphatidylglycerol:prolipoprotein diacylglycerol transferase
VIPYIHVPDLSLGFVSLHPFGLLVATGVIIGTILATRRARRRGLDVDELNSFITWMLVCGFLGGHMLDQIFYHWGDLWKPREQSFLHGYPGFLSIFMLWEGLSSFGGFTGALIGIVLWKYFEAVTRENMPRWVVVPRFLVPFLPFVFNKFKVREQNRPILPFADLILSVFPVAWIFGRMGCSVVHDHPGARAPAGTLLAVMYGRPEKVTHLFGGIELRYGNAPQFDLGTLEMLFTVILAASLALTWHKKLTTGTYVAATALAYAPVRFAMDFLRVHEGESADPRTLHLTPAQFACMALFVFGLVMVAHVRRVAASGKDPLDVYNRTPERAPDPPIEPPLEAT